MTNVDRGGILNLWMTDIIWTEAQLQDIKSEVTQYLILILHLITDELQM